MDINGLDFVGALDTLVFVYDLADDILAWKRPARVVDGQPILLLSDGQLNGKPMLEMIWAICVELFGDWVNSPATGWIEAIDEFYEFLNEITATARENDLNDLED